MPEIKLRPYQEEAINRTLSRFKTHRSALVVLAVGLGKSWVMTNVAKEFKRVVFLQPCLELVDQNHSKLVGSGLNSTMISSGHKTRNWSADYIYTTPQTLCKNLDRLDEPDLIVIDECFTGDTLVATPDGYKSIKDIKVGDKVYNATGVGTVLAKTIKHTHKTKTMELSNGEKITGTYSHPVFTKYGWTRFEHVGKGETLFGIQDMPRLWTNVSPSARLFNKRSTIRKEGLLQLLLRESKGKTGQSTEEYKNKIANWWKREAHAIAGSTPTPNAKRRLGNRICDTNRTQPKGRVWLSHLLQTGFSRPKKKNRNRSGWRVSSMSRTKNVRRKEKSVFGTVRVENISYNEQAGNITVYNLHVSGHPSYFAGGVLVHNCNVFFEGTMFDAIFSRWKKCKIMALTATPYYYRRKAVYRSGWVWSQTTIVSIEEFFGPAVINIDRDEGYALGYSPKIEIKKADIQYCNADHINNQIFYKNIVDKHIVGVNNLLKTLRNGIIFCDSIKHAALLSETFNIPTVFGSTPKKRRADLIKRFNQGRIPFLLTVGCLVRGYDRQDLENIVLLSNFKNACEFEQVLGRLNRGTCSKTCWYNGVINTTKPEPGKVELVRIKRIGQ